MKGWVALPNFKGLKRLLAGRTPSVLVEFFRQEEGQATVEYILILSVTVVITVAVMRKFVGPVFKKVTNTLSNRIEKQVFGANLHHYRVPR